MVRLLAAQYVASSISPSTTHVESLYVAQLVVGILGMSPVDEFRVGSASDHTLYGNSRPPIFANLVCKSSPVFPPPPRAKYEDEGTRNTFLTSLSDFEPLVVSAMPILCGAKRNIHWVRCALYFHIVSLSLLSILHGARRNSGYSAPRALERLMTISKFPTRIALRGQKAYGGPESPWAPVREVPLRDFTPSRARKNCAQLK